MPEKWEPADYPLYEKRLIWATAVPVPRPGSKHLLLTLAVYSNGDGESWMTQDQIARFMGTARETVSRHLAMLEKEGHITRRRRQRLPDLITLTPPAWVFEKNWRDWA